MSYYVLRDDDDKPIGDVRICYRYVWDDPQWCELNGVMSPDQRRSIVAKRAAATRRARRLNDRRR